MIFSNCVDLLTLRRSDMSSTENNSVTVENSVQPVSAAPAGQEDEKAMLAEIIGVVRRVEDNQAEERRVRETHDVMIRENKEAVTRHEVSISNLVQRVNSTQATNLMLRREQYTMKRQMLKLSSSLQKVREEAAKDMKEQEREARILVISTFEMKDLKDFKDDEGKISAKSFAFTQLKGMHSQLRRSDIIFAQTKPTTKGRFRLVTEISTRPLASLIRNKAQDAGYTVRQGEAKIYREMMGRAGKNVKELNENTPDGAGYHHVVRQGHRVFRVYDDGSEEELFAETSAELGTIDLRLDHALYDFVGDSGEEDDLDDLEEERRALEIPEYIPEDKSLRVAERRKRRREVVTDANKQILGRSPPKKKGKQDETDLGLISDEDNMEVDPNDENAENTENDTVAHDETLDQGMGSKDGASQPQAQSQQKRKKPTTKERKEGDSHPPPATRGRPAATKGGKRGAGKTRADGTGANTAPSTQRAQPRGGGGVRSGRSGYKPTKPPRGEKTNNRRGGGRSRGQPRGRGLHSMDFDSMSVDQVAELLKWKQEQAELDKRLASLTKPGASNAATNPSGGGAAADEA